MTPSVPGRAARGSSNRIVRSVLAAAMLGAVPAGAQDLALRNVRLFDGERVHERTTVVVREGRIASIGPRTRIPAGMEVIEGAGATLLPALIDAHTHTFSREHLATALAYGVVANFDMFGSPAITAPIVAEQRAGGGQDRADLRSAMIVVTAPGGHGTQYGMPIPTITSPDEADEFVEQRIAEGSEWIKIILERGGGRRQGFNSLDSATMHAAVDAAHARGRLAVVHATTLQLARQAVQAGADGLVHLWVDSLPEAAFVSELARRGVFVIPTLTVIEGVTGTPSGAGLLADSSFAARLGPEARESLGRAFPTGAAPPAFHTPLQSLEMIARAGVRVLVGSDAPNPGTWFGASVHRELELLVQAGLPPLQALQGATSVAAQAFRLPEYGRLRVGADAHMLLVRGNPLDDITRTRDIARVWKRGRELDLGAFEIQAAERLAAHGATPVRPEALQPGFVLSDFENGTSGTAFGSGWVETTDVVAGGSSAVALRLVDGGDAGSARALEIRGDIAPGLPFAWSGAIFYPAARPMEPADLSSTSGFSFSARGDEGTYRVFVFTRSGGQMPAIREFTAGPEWGTVSIRWSDLGGDGSDVSGVAIVGGPTPGGFVLRIDRVVFD